MTDDSYFNISEIKLSITSLYIISYTHKCDIIRTENSDVIYFRDIILSSTENPGPYYSHPLKTIII